MFLVLKGGEGLTTNRWLLYKKPSAAQYKQLEELLSNLRTGRTFILKNSLYICLLKGGLQNYGFCI